MSSRQPSKGDSKTPHPSRYPKYHDCTLEINVESPSGTRTERFQTVMTEQERKAVGRKRVAAHQDKGS